MRFSSEIADYFYNLIEDINTDLKLSERKRIARFKQAYSEILKKITSNENQIFSSSFTRALFISDKYRLHESLNKRLNEMRRVMANLNYLQHPAFNPINSKKIYETLRVFIAFFSPENKNDEKPPEQFTIHEDCPDYSISESDSNLIRVGVRQIHNKVLVCQTEEGKLINVRLKGKWSGMAEYIETDTILHLINFEMMEENEVSYLVSSNESIIVYEPDVLIDVTDISGCFEADGPKIYSYLLKKILPSDVSFKLVLGNIVNTIFDRLLNEPGSAFNDCYEYALSIKPFQIFSLAVKERELIPKLRSLAEVHYNNLSKIIPGLKSGNISIEPTFISPKYGLQGRLDLLEEFDPEPDRKNIVELKSGSSPNTTMTSVLPNGNRVQTGIWNEHFVQTTLYNLLLDSAVDSRKGSSRILYSADFNTPLRNAPNILYKKQEAIAFRNKLIAIDKKIINEDYSFFSELNPDNVAPAADYKIRELKKFNEVFQSVTDLERSYFLGMLTFITAESYTARTGNGGNGFSSLWNESIEEKAVSMNILFDLTIDYEHSDFDKFHIVFGFGRANAATSIRKGDIIILYPLDENGESLLLKGQIIKGHVKETDSDKIIISLRNKQFPKQFFARYRNWVIEPDYVDNSSRLIKSIFNFLSADEIKRKTILGLREPEFGPKPDLELPELSPQKLHIIQKAVSAKDYFIIQGPPGTGKTSFILKEIVRYIFVNTDENILVLAYTNRAVDEICSALQNLSDDFDYLRLGNKESSEHQKNLIAGLAGELPFGELYKRTKRCRVIVSTVLSVISNPEIFEMKRFQTAIVDEASQILESQLTGILARVNRFILIGDEKQLPAIVLQPEEKTKVTDRDLISIELLNYNSSLFERLLRVSRNKCRHYSYSMLSEQARMHNDIQNLVNYLFYENALKTINVWQKAADRIFPAGSNSKIASLLGRYRVIFINTNHENRIKIHQKEAKLATEIIIDIEKAYGSDFCDSTIGVITPFRAQCSEIYNHLPEKLLKKVTIDTVERYQGSERDVIIISFATNFEYLLRSISSLVEFDGKITDRKLNVAITRARQNLIILGNASVLSESDIFNKLLFNIKQNYCYLESDDFEFMIKN